ncbi:MAG TPA: polyphenol oxidase family protein [Candidatus Hydrogenedentes bacterium]|mgnify:CR=1 FL=1|nr:polyphenol oxidase family protein [Candidatus Hydrogenedentota bacterium]HPG67245.1 polyphenol oxidase family protein [Candidatus Hydrogenedentota bacterium]
MVHFEVLERLGVSTAVLSDKCDGDMALRESGEGGGVAARAQACAACGVRPENLVLGRQVHGTGIAIVGLADRGRGALTRATAIETTDGLVTAESGVPMAILVADCVPVYLFDPSRRAAGLVHAGRRGTFGNVAGRAVRVMAEALGTRVDDLHAVIGPSAGPCCYEVSEELARDFREAGLPVRGRHLDLWEANARQLAGAGVPAGNISTMGVCTICSGRFHSFRRDGGKGRNMALLAV